MSVIVTSFFLHHRNHSPGGKEEYSATCQRLASIQAAGLLTTVCICEVIISPKINAMNMKGHFKVIMYYGDGLSNLRTIKPMVVVQLSKTNLDSINCITFNDNKTVIILWNHSVEAQLQPICKKHERAFCSVQFSKTIGSCTASGLLKNVADIPSACLVFAHFHSLNREAIQWYNKIHVSYSHNACCVCVCTCLFSVTPFMLIVCYFFLNVAGKA